LEDARKKVLLIDDHALVADAIAVMLKRQFDWDVRTATTIASAQQIVESEKVDLIVADFLLPDTSGGKGIAQLAKLQIAPVIVLTALEDDLVALRAKAAGAIDVIRKSDPIPLVLARIKKALNRACAPMPDINDGLDVPLTELQMKILGLITQGQSNKCIGEKLGLQETNVKFRVSDLMRKIGVRNRTQLALWWLDAA